MARESRDSDISVQVTRPDKPFFPDDGISKGDLVGYYRQVAPAIIPYLRDRPLVMGRYLDGITGQRIVQKNASQHFPDWVRKTEVKKKDGTVCHVVCDRAATLVYLANQACIELQSSSAISARLTGLTSSCSISPSPSGPTTPAAPSAFSGSARRQETRRRDPRGARRVRRG